MKSVANMVLGSGITEPGFDRITDFPHIPGINNSAGVGRVGKGNVATGYGLQMPIANVQFPTFDLLEKADRSDVLVVVGGSIPAKERVAIDAQARPTEMFAKKHFRFDS